MVLIDTHTHLYLHDFKNDIDDVMLRAFNEGIARVYLPAIDSSETESLLRLENKYPGRCVAMMGLHPCSVKENYKDELSLVNEWLQKRRFAAVGEIGLDFYWDKTFAVQQYESFYQQIEWALQYDSPIVIHTRNALRETIDIVKAFSGKGLRGVFHCFSGTYDDALEIIETGFLLGIGGVVTYKNSGIAEAINKVGMEHIVLETDAPYLTPVPFRGKRNESSYLKHIVKKIAEIKNIAPDDVAAITTENAQRLFSREILPDK